MNVESSEHANDIRTRGDSTPCSVQPQMPDESLFQHLQRIVLFISITPTIYQEAVTYQGHESDYAPITAYRSPQRSAAAIKDLVTHYQQYPAPLHRDNLIKVFTNQITKFITPYLERGPDCKPNAIIVPDVYGTDPQSDKPNTLTIFITLDINDYVQPRIAIIDAKYYRPGRTDAEFLEDLRLEHPAAIPLTLSDSDISQELAKFRIAIPTTGLMH